MPAFDDRAWVHMWKRFESEKRELVNSPSTRSVMQGVFDGWAMVVAHAPDEDKDYGSRGASLKRVSAQTREFYVFQHPTMVAAVSLNPYSPSTSRTGTREWQHWHRSTLAMREETVRYALQGHSDVAETLMGLADQMVTSLSSADEEERTLAQVWEGHVHRLVPAGLAELDPVARGSYELLAGLGAYDR